MEMTTRTQLQTHFGRLLDLASQPSPPLRPTFWDKLDLDGRRASVDQERSWKFNNESAWNPIGAVKDEWNKSIYPGAIKPLLQDNTRMVYKNVKRQTPYSVCCWMIGKEWHLSRPAAIIICGNKKVTKNAVKLIEGHGELGRTWGFRVYGYESKISITVGTSANDNDDYSPLCAISGTRFAVGGRDGISTRTATLGGSIVIDGEYFGVTVVHPFMNFPQDESSDEDESDMSDDSSEMTDTVSCSGNAHVTLVSDVAFVEDPGSHQRRTLGWIPIESRFDCISQSQDWALLKLRQADLTINLMSLGDKLVIPWRVSESVPGGELWAAVSPEKPVRTKASSSICGLFAPHFGLQDVWAMNMKRVPGYCGSWVVDASAEAIFGMIVAGSEANDISYALPAYVVFDEIRGRFPSMQLQSLQQIAALPVLTFVEIIHKAKELGLTQFVTEVVSKHSSLDNKDSSGYTPLCRAILKGYEAVVASFLEAGASPNLVGTDSEMRPLALAAEEGHLAIAKLLLSAGADPNSLSGHEENTPLVYAARRGHRAMTILLIVSGARVNFYGALGSTPLAEAALHGDEEVISILISSGANIDKKDLIGRTPLMQAVLAYNEETVRALLEKRADVNCVDDDGSTPLLVAATFEDPAIVKLLIASGADINKKDLRGHTPLLMAVLSYRETSARVLLEHGADVNCVDNVGTTPLLAAAKFEDPAIAKLLIASGADINKKDLRGRTLLMKAVSDRDEKAARGLLEHGADVNCVDYVGTTPLLVAAKFEDPAIVKLLIASGADINKKDLRGHTPFMKAVLSCCETSARVLLEHGADIDCVDDDGNTPLLLASRSIETEHVKFLVANDADINKKGFRGRTPLMEAVLANNKENVRVLLERGADVNCADVNGNTPLLLAAESDNLTIIKLLIERGAWVDTRNKDGDTALILTVKTEKSSRSFGTVSFKIGRDKIVRTLLEHGANPDSQDAQANTALSLAITGGLDSIIRILLDHAADMHITNSLGQTPWSLAQQNENIARILNVDPAGLDDKRGKLPSVCPPAPSNSPVMEPRRTACNSCLARKVSCDWEKPECYNCRISGKTCVYPSDKTDPDNISWALDPLLFGPLWGPLPSESLPMSEPAEETRQKEKQKLGESLWDIDERMAEEYWRIYRRT